MGTHCKLSRTITVNGVEYADENILEGWAKHFEKLGTPETDGFNETLKNQVRWELASMEQVSKEESDELLTSISEAEVEAAIRSLQVKSCRPRSYPAGAPTIWW